MSTAIEWTDETWNPTRGCSRVSAGCDHCYAMRQAHRFSGVGQPYEGLTRLTARGPDWSGKVVLARDMLDIPMHWRRPRKVFVNSMSDLFHPALSNEDIAAVFNVMAACPQHTFQVLTKRPERAARWFEWAAEQVSSPLTLYLPRARERRWPLVNVWLGTSVETQRHAESRIPDLLECPAVVRFISAEPLLGPLDLHNERQIGGDHDWLTGESYDWSDGTAAPRPKRAHLDWVIVGGESGHGARDFEVQWARSIVLQCKRAGVACFVKQLGRRPFGELRSLLCLTDRKGGDWRERDFPEALKVRQFPGGCS